MRPFSISSFQRQYTSAMKYLIAGFGVLAFAFAIADLVHGQHNGDGHRYYIHLAEFCFFFGFLLLLKIKTFRRMIGKLSFEPWLAALILSIVSLLAGFGLAAGAGGSLHGDGGPLSASFALIGAIATVTLPISLFGAVVHARDRFEP